MKPSFECLLAQIRAQDRTIYSRYDFDSLIVSQENFTIRGRLKNGETVLLASYDSEEGLREAWAQFAFVSGCGAGIFTFPPNDYRRAQPETLGGERDD